ncbi:MAG: PEP-CTERM sorting domain-containing protein [Candidatus Marinimicrobia bacterium]|nr:PEP-CTERM sorting domain-containing protein [Candidatus Neomarinimicrobiota bacterium]
MRKNMCWILGTVAWALTFTAVADVYDFDYSLYCSEDAVVRADTPDNTDANARNNYINQHEWMTNTTGRSTTRIWLKFELPALSAGQSIANAHFEWARGGSTSDGRLYLYEASNVQSDGTTPWGDEDWGTDTTTATNITWNRQGTIGSEIGEMNGASSLVVANAGTFFQVSTNNNALTSYLNDYAGTSAAHVSFALRIWHKDYPDGPWNDISPGNWWFQNDENSVTLDEDYKRPTLSFDIVPEPGTLSLLLGAGVLLFVRRWLAPPA